MFTRTPRLMAISIVLLAASVSIAGGFEETVRVHADELIVVDLVGHVEVVRGDGDAYEVEVKVRGEDASRDDIEIVVEEKGDAAYVRVLFPVDEHKTFIYPELGRSKTQIRFRESDASGDDSFWNKLANAMGGRKITLKGHGRGYEAWADLVVRVPDGGDATVKIGAGDIEAEEVEADLWLDTHSGPVTAKRIIGDLVCDTGSGTVEVRDCEGTVNVDTGSGGVYGANLIGDKVHIDTGSGSVVFELLEMGDGKFLVDTGSGGVDLILPDDASCRVSCDTGSGGVRVDVPGVDIRRRDNDEVNFTVGGGEARVILDTGSGGITVKMAS